MNDHYSSNLFAQAARNIAEKASQELLRLKEPNKNYLGEDIDPETLSLIDRLEHRPASVSCLSPFQVAQLKELAFWRWVAYEGYMGNDPRSFPWFQRLFMTGIFLQTGWNMDELHNANVVEIGCGPLGMIEYLPGKRKVAYDPLNEHYSKLFRNARNPDIEYTVDFSGLLRAGCGTFDLGICFNVLDHTTEPRALFDSFMDLIKPGGRFLFEVNTVKEGEPQTETHRKMHPSPFTAEKIGAWLDEYGRGYQKTHADQPSPENEYFFMAWGYKNTAA